MATNYLVLLSLCVTSLVSSELAATKCNDQLGHSGLMERFGLGRREGTLDKTPQSLSYDLIKNDSEVKQVTSNDLRDLPELSIFKRAPTGFTGVRGKKDFEYPDSSRIDQSIGLDDNILYISDPHFGFKRVPAGFTGVRGKKAALGFYGVRGKKDTNDYGYEHYDDLEVDPDILDNFSRLFNPAEDHQVDWNDGEFGKRAPNSAFFAVRGKKYLYDGLNLENELDKRAPTGFMGVRGRRLFDYAFDENKRAPKGFFGVRGKKDVSKQLSEEKRSALTQFFGSRGKKQPLNSGFFGMRGKKQPFGFRNKFVGVRGKKTSDGSLKRLELRLNEFPTGNERFLVDPLEIDANKRAPNGFVGMRGKKDSGADTINAEK